MSNIQIVYFEITVAVYIDLLVASILKADAVYELF